MPRKTALILQAAAGVVLFAQTSYAGASADVADPMRRARAAFATSPIERCQNIAGSQWWFADPNCKAAAEYAAEESAPVLPRSAAPRRTWHGKRRPVPAP